MPDTLTLAAFVAASVTLIVVPGPNLVYIATRSLAQGTRAGVVSALGVETATAIFVLATALGVGGLVARSDGLVTAIKVLGACYLVHLALGALRSRPAEATGPSPARNGLGMYAAGVAVNLLNPKVLIFFVAFFPQFVDHEGGASPTTQLLVLGGVFMVLALTLDLLCAVVGGALASRVVHGDGAMGWMRVPVAGVYAALAVSVAWSVA